MTLLEQPKPKLDIYRVIVCDVAIPNAANGLLTYVNVHEGWMVPEALFGTTRPVCALFSLAGFGDYEIRIVWVDEFGKHESAGDQVDKITIKGRQRFASQTLKVPKRPGFYALTLEWRMVGDQAWTLGNGQCPIMMDVAKPPPGATPEAPSASTAAKPGLA